MIIVFGIGGLFGFAIGVISTMMFEVTKNDGRH